VGIMEIQLEQEHSSKAPDRRAGMSSIFRKLWNDESGQDIAEYAVMLAVILVLVVGTVKLVGSNANNAFSAAARSLQ
jgi:Flp pilus assembly pilin Flp